MKFLQESWKSFKRLFKKEKEEKRKPRKLLIDKDFSLRQESTQLEIDTKPSPPIRKKREPIHIQVGLDFGTSCTKVVYSQAGRRLKKALSFDHDLSIYPNYWIPSLAAISPKGEFLLGIEAARHLMDKEWDSGFQRFKVIVAGKYDESFRDTKTEENFLRHRIINKYPESFTPEKVTAIYLAHTMNKCRNLIMNLREYQDTEVDMAFNICMPIEHIENNAVRTAFEDIFTKAEAIERAMQDLGEKFIPVIDDPKPEYFPSKEEKRVFAIPEAVAGIASYLISLRREDGLHAIIDLGAGTTDISISNLVSPKGESESLWYAAKNIPLGTINIERHIADYIKACHEHSAKCTCSDVHDILNSLQDPSFQNDKSDNRKGILNKIALDELSAIRDCDHYRHAWGGAYDHLKSQTKWEGVGVLLSGGGASFPFAERVFEIPWWEQIQSRYSVSRLPIPEDYDQGDAEAPFERMAVAYGLSIPRPELERYTMPKDSPDQTPPKLHYVLPDRDEIYAK